MINISVDVVDNSDEAWRLLDLACDRALEAVGMQAEGHSKVLLERNPRRIDTGLLRNSITHARSGEPAAISHYSADKPKEGKKKNSGTYSGQAPVTPDGIKTVWIGTNVEYAIYVHNGTRRMAANRFLQNAITDYRDEYAAILKAYISGNE